MIHGLGGRDRIFGGGGADIICGGEGSDLIKGQKGKDTIFGNEGRDRLVGGQGADIVDGGRGNDSVRGGFGDDTLVTGPGDDFVRGGGGLDDCDFDRNDTYDTCELGDVAGQHGFGSPTFSVDVPADFAFVTFDFNGPVDAFVLDIAVASWDGGDREVIVDVLDQFGNTIFSDGAIGSSFAEMFVVAGNNPSTIAVSGLGPDDFYDISFRTHRNLPRLGFDEAVGGVGNLVFKWKSPVPADSVFGFSVESLFEEFTADTFVVGYAGGRAPTLLASLESVGDLQEVTGPATAGRRVYYVYGLGTAWCLAVESPA